MAAKTRLPKGRKAKSNGGKEPGPQLTFHYIKGNQFRVIHGDGVQGGLTPKGNAIQMAIFSERLPIPVQTTHLLEAGGKVGAETSREGRKGVVREVEVEVILGVYEAESIAKWLEEKVKLAKRIASKRRAK